MDTTTDPRWEEVAELQKVAWQELARTNPNYESQDVEDVFYWQQARILADEIMNG